MKQALRFLVKAGHRGALDLLGVGAPPKVRIGPVRISPRRVKKGGRTVLTCELSGTARAPQELMIDYAVHYVKANGRSSPKVFKWKRITLAPGACLPIRIQIRLADLTTRKHHPGRHGVELLVNGRTFELASFDLIA